MGSSAASDSFTLALTLPLPYEQAVAAVRKALSDQGFGILTEIDLAAIMKEKLGEDLAPQVILGACRPPLAHRALLADPSVATMLPCNVVVRALDADHLRGGGVRPRRDDVLLHRRGHRRGGRGRQATPHRSSDGTREHPSCDRTGVLIVPELEA